MLSIGFEACKDHFSFTKYVLEKKKVNFEKFLIEIMGSEEYDEFQKIQMNQYLKVYFCRETE